jgi:hypothetical protein
MSDDTPTERFDSTPGSASSPSASTSSAVAAAPRSNTLVLVLIAAGAALLIAILVVLVLNLNNGDNGNPVANVNPTQSTSESESGNESPSPAESATPEESESASPSQTQAAPPPPADNGPKIKSFKVNPGTVYCNSQAPNPVPLYVSFSWTTSNVDAVYFGANTDDASAEPYFTNLPPSGTNADFPEGNENFAYACGAAKIKYTLTVIGSNGHKVSKSVTVTNKGDVDP